MPDEHCCTTSASRSSAAGEIARALAVFLELQADADRYRDVHARIGRLSRVQTGGLAVRSVSRILLAAYFSKRA